MGEFGMLRSEIWSPEKKIVNEMFDKSGALLPMYMQYFDMPEIYQPSLAGMDFIYALAECKDVDLFKNKSIQMIITA